MAIIDILTHYDAKKKAAHAAKTVKHGVSIEMLILFMDFEIRAVGFTELLYLESFFELSAVINAGHCGLEGNLKQSTLTKC